MAQQPGGRRGFGQSDQLRRGHDRLHRQRRKPPRFRQKSYVGAENEGAMGIVGVLQKFVDRRAVAFAERGANRQNFNFTRATAQCGNAGFNELKLCISGRCVGHNVDRGAFG